MSGTVSNLAHLLDDKADTAPAPEVMAPTDYHRLLTRLLDEGIPQGKSQPVAAYLLRPLSFVNEDDDQQHRVGVEPSYIVMDPKMWPNEYARKLAMEEIFRKYAHQVIEPEETNTPDFKGPGIWSTKRKSFEADYIQDTDKDPQTGRRVNVWRPNPLAHRLCIDHDGDTFTMPTTWGSYVIKPGSTVALRSADLPALVEAMQQIAQGKTSIEDALYTTDKKGNRVARFDIYGMEPGFRAENYDTVALADRVAQPLADWRNKPAPGKAAGRKLPQP